uniref:Uncharacterized protein n=1 Tax=Romanomermis culicivorax TaxID=13658 RepID=A0A915KZJ5_ROMCU
MTTLSGAKQKWPAQDERDSNFKARSHRLQDGDSDGDLLETSSSANVTLNVLLLLHSVSSLFSEKCITKESSLHFKIYCGYNFKHETEFEFQGTREFMDR